MSNPKPVFLVASSFMPEVHGSLDPYGMAVHPVLEKRGGSSIVVGETAQIMDHFEGKWKDDPRFALFGVPPMEALQGFRYSDEYQAVKHLRTDVILPNFTFAVEAFDPEE
ncbi:DUF1330 domain-containing protein [Phaeobacter sp. NW0010-22]|uniref:DUF1330 domain-containing protein n=1 Tax=Phaeobacter sp. NW0010-22 TaxID=3135907 RepID=UPI003104BE00